MKTLAYLAGKKYSGTSISHAQSVFFSFVGLIFSASLWCVKNSFNLCWTTIFNYLKSEVVGLAVTHQGQGTYMDDKAISCDWLDSVEIHNHHQTFMILFKVHWPQFRTLNMWGVGTCIEHERYMS